MNGNLISPRLARLIVVVPTVFFTLWLGNVGFPVLPRVAAGISLGAILILGVSRLQRWRVTQ